MSSRSLAPPRSPLGGPRAATGVVARRRPVLPRGVPILGLLGLASGCQTPAWQQTPHDLRFQRVPPPILHERPEKTEPTDWWYTLEQTTTRPLGRALSPIHWIDQASGGLPAHDVNNFGEVMDSPWFENRLGRRRMTVEDVVRGPNTLDGPAPGPLRVLNGKVVGASAGLTLEDAQGHRFLVKFDPPAYPGLATGAELITTKILHAAGYYVPENYIHRFSLRDLVLTPGAKGPGPHGTVKPMTQANLKDLMMLANPTLGDEVQALFSRIIEGEPMGPFTYEGRRRDDPNDTIPHERRRSLRGYRWFCAWTNNTDTRASNSLDVFRPSSEDESTGHLVHYLLDFGNSLGSLGTKPKYPSDGYDPVISWTVLGELFFTAGIRYRYWLPVERSPFRSIGIFEAKVFEPSRWTPSIANPAFLASTAHDDFWAAAIIARFTKPMLEGIVQEARYRDPRAGDYVVEVLWARREKILRRAFRRMAPLHDAEVRGTEVRWVDLGALSGLDRVQDLAYRYRLVHHGQGQISDEGEVSEPVLDLGLAAFEGRNQAALERNPFFTLEVYRSRKGREDPAVKLHLRWRGDRFSAVGIDRNVR